MPAWIFKGIIYCDATDPMTGEVSKQPYTVTLYHNGEVVTRWCGEISERSRVNLALYEPQVPILMRLSHYLKEEIQKIDEGEEQETTEEEELVFELQEAIEYFKRATKYPNVWTLINEQVNGIVGTLQEEIKRLKQL